ncbi:MAG: protein kinase [Gemmatimonadales bacterium]
MAESVAGLSAALADRYRIERELGRGGMATVYLVHDLRHDRPIALKVLHPQLAAALGPERFQREIRIAARLQHPHILTVLDSGDTAGILWFTMPFVRGESLRDRLNREKQLPVEDALRIAREAADALDYAHHEGIIHRDVKPENILLAGTHALVADFGIARALGAEPESKLTETGLSIGTPAYMSPEQAAGDRNLDARTDIYSLGIVLYEMLAGETPFAAPTAQAMIARRFTESPRPLGQLRDTIPETLAHAVAKALARQPADRYSTAAEFARALESPATAAATGSLSAPAATTVIPSPPPAASGRRHAPLTLALGVGFVLGLGVLFGWLRTHGTADPAGGIGPRLLAVLPFENLGRQGDEYFADGVTDEVRGKLAALPGLQVTARSSSNQYKRTSKTPREIGRELGVDYLLTGTVRWEKSAAGSHVRVSPELIQVSTGSTRWQQPFDAALTDVFRVQADVAGRVAQALDVALGTPQRTILAEKPTANAAAYDAYLKGEAASQNMGSAIPLDLRRAVDFYEQAVALDSTFAQAWAQLSRAYSTLYANGTPSPEAQHRAREAADRALRLAPGQPAGHLAMGDYFSIATAEYGKGLEEYEAGLRVSPNDADLIAGSALAEINVGRWEDALAHFTRARAIDPRSVATGRRLSYTYLRLRRFPEAIAASERTLAIDPGNVGALEIKVMALLGQGDLAAAQRLVLAAPAEIDPATLAATFANYFDLYWVLPPGPQDLLVRLTPTAFNDRAVWAIVLAEAHHLRGDVARARAFADTARTEFTRRVENTPNDAQSRVFLGLALAYLGLKAEAITEGERGVALQPTASYAYNGPYLQHQLVRIYLLVGEPEKALDLLEPLLKVPYYLSPGWLRIDPNFDPLRTNPRFQRLVGGS